MNRGDEKSDAMPTDLITEVLASHANPGGAGGTQDIDIQVVPLLSGNGISGRHRSQASTSVLLASAEEVKAGQKPPSKRIAEHQKLLIQQQDAAVVCCVSGKMVAVDTVLNLSGVVQMVDSDISKYRIEII
jgi:hypothetical protein